MGTDTIKKKIDDLKGQLLKQEMDEKALERTKEAKARYEDRKARQEAENVEYRKSVELLIKTLSGVKTEVICPACLMDYRLIGGQKELKRRVVIHLRNVKGDFICPVCGLIIDRSSIF